MQADQESRRDYRGPAFDLGPQHRLVGLITWAAVALCLFGLLRFPGATMLGVAIFIAYLLARMAIAVAFSIVGTVRCRDWERRDWSSLPATGGPRLSSADVQHVVLVPNYSERLDVLEATLDALTKQDMARERLTVVLAMEQKESGSAEKAQSLVERFSGGFRHMLVTIHPAGLPGEIPCKGSNDTWAARAAKRTLCEERGVPVERIVVTVIDADSILNPHYLAAVERAYATDPRRDKHLWQAPMMFYNNIWKVPAPVRFMAYIAQTLGMADLSNPFCRPLPISTYSLSMRLLEAVGFWDPAVISEDWHIYLQAFFANRGEVRLFPIFLPTRADAPDGETRWIALKNLYHQSVRHSWGAEDVGYILSMWKGSRVPTARKVRQFEQVLRGHLLRTIPWWVFVTGWIVSAMTLSRHDAVLRLFPDLPQVLQYLWIGGSVSIVLMLVVELMRNPPEKLTSLPWRLAEMLLVWMFLPAYTLVFAAWPAMYAQSKLMLGMHLNWRVTPKRLAEPLNEA